MKSVRFSFMVTEVDLDNLKLDAESLEQSEDADVSRLGRKMKRAVNRAAKRIGFSYAPTPKLPNHPHN